MDNNFERIMQLMEHKSPSTKQEKKKGCGVVECTQKAGDGSTYGVIRENNKFYVKRLNDSNAELIAENFVHLSKNAPVSYDSIAVAKNTMSYKVRKINEDTGLKEAFDLWNPNKATLLNEGKALRDEMNREKSLCEGKVIDADNTGNPEAPKDSKSTATTAYVEKGKPEENRDNAHKEYVAPKGNVKPDMERDVKIQDKDSAKMVKPYTKQAPKQVNEEQETIYEIELHSFGDHPRYGKEPMSTPAEPSGEMNDWADSSLKHKGRYSQKIGDSAPFVDAVTESVLKKLGLKKK